VGIDNYEVDPLGSCVNDAKAMAELLDKHDDGTENFTHVVTMVSSEDSPVLRQDIVDKFGDLLLQDADSELLFYFSGHGRETVLGAELVAQDPYGAAGISMDQLAAASNRAAHRSLTIILDCCFAGGVGQLVGDDSGNLGRIQLARGTALLAASREAEPAFAGDEHSRFTAALLDGLKGAASDIYGRVTPAGLHALANASLGGAENRDPVLKVYSEGSALLRQCAPPVTSDQLGHLPTVFEDDDGVIRPLDTVLGPEAGVTNPGDLEALAIQAFLRAGLIVINRTPTHVELVLTAQGRHCRRLVREGLISTQ
jgi:hypothetical protein